MADVKVGKVTHYYDKIGVAVVQLEAPLSVGDKIKITGHENEFSQAVSSMQYDHKDLQKAEKGKDIGLKVDQKVKEGDEVYRA